MIVPEITSKKKFFKIKGFKIVMHQLLLTILKYQKCYYYSVKFWYLSKYKNILKLIVFKNKITYKILNNKYKNKKLKIICQAIKTPPSLSSNLWSQKVTFTKNEIF